MQNLFVTGGAGFIGSAFIRYLFQNPTFTGRILNYDLLTYAANLDNLKDQATDPRYQFIQGDIRNQPLLEKIFLEHRIDCIVHFAAETQVDRSILSAAPFIETNVNGTLSLLEAVRKFPHIHFHHISTDEVYGALGPSGTFNEESPYRPNSPYSASKAASDHLVRAFTHTYQLKTTISHCSNYYGPGQHREKFIPLMIHHCLEGKPLPVYGQGLQVRDWLFVDDHAAAIWTILERGEIGETYDIGGNQEMKNIDLLHLLIDIMAEHTQQKPETYHSLIQFVPDRPGHDFRYAIDTTKIQRELSWQQETSIEIGLRKTARYYTTSLCRS